MMRVVRAALFWLAVAFAIVALCSGSWVLWVSDDPTLLGTGPILLLLAELTRRWSKPDRPPGRYDDVPLFIAITLFVPVVTALTYLVISTIFVTMFMMPLRLLFGFREFDDTFDVSIAGALAAAGAFVLIAFRRARQVQRDEVKDVPG